LLVIVVSGTVLLFAPEIEQITHPGLYAAIALSREGERWWRVGTTCCALELAGVLGLLWQRSRARDDSNTLPAQRLRWRQGP
jgi:hypothetical protein